MGRPCGDARVRGLPASCPFVLGAVLRRDGGGQRRTCSASRAAAGCLDALLRAAGGDHAAVGDARAAALAGARGDARRRGAQRRIRLPRGQLRRRSQHDQRRRPAPARLGGRTGDANRARRRAPRDGESRTRRPSCATPAQPGRRGRGGGRHRRRECRRAGEHGRATAASRLGGGRRARSANGTRDTRRPPTAQAQASGRGLQNGLQSPSFAGREQDFANEQLEAELPRAHQPGVGRAGRGGAAQPARRHAARRRRAGAPTTAPGRASTSPTRRMGDWTPDEREALRTLAAASPDVRAAAIHDVLGDGDHADPPVRRRGGPGHASVHEQSGGGTIDAGPEPPHGGRAHDVATRRARRAAVDPARQPGPTAGRESGGPPAQPSAAVPTTRSGRPGGARVNAAPAHLEAKLRFWEFTVGQIAAAVRRVLCRLRVGVVPEPVRRAVARRSAAPTSPACPVAAGVRGQPDRVRPVGPVCGAIARWRRLDGRYLPGAGQRPRGYVAHRATPARAGARSAARGRLDLDALWERRMTRRRATSARATGGDERAARGERTLPQAGELLAVEAIDRTGLIVTSEGAFVRIFAGHAAQPADHVRRGARDDRRGLPAAARPAARRTDAAVLHRRAPGQPRRELLADVPRARCEAARAGARRERPARDAMALSRWRLYAALEESLRLHADEQAAVAGRAPTWSSRSCRARRRAGRAGLGCGAAGCARRAAGAQRCSAHRRAVRESLAHVDALRAELEARGLADARCSTASEVLALLWARVQPDAGRRAAAGPPPARSRCSASSTPPGEREQARAAPRCALRGGDRAARASTSRASHQRVDGRPRRRADRSTSHTTAAADARWAGCSARCSPASRSRCSVYVHALDRRRERQRLKLAYRRLFAINRGAEQRGRVPDFDRYVAGARVRASCSARWPASERAGLFERLDLPVAARPRPDPDLAALAEAVDYCAEHDRVGRRLQGQPRRVPPARAVAEHAAARARRRAPQRASTPTAQRRRHASRWSAPTCGSPTGIPFAFADPGRTRRAA